MKRIYLSGPMIGLPGFNFPTSTMAASLLEVGHTATNATELNPG
ncbi:DUF4406 domain-containing protein [Pseudomonas sp. SR18]|nr:DUF4406 domain-containing protein [Pseudomonas sp. SR18]MCM2361539.1 DUF4406 domain-containing protein [Pseudomonas sp. SR18]